MVMNEERIKAAVLGAVAKGQPDPEMWAKVRRALPAGGAAPGRGALGAKAGAGRAARARWRWAALGAAAAVLLAALFLPLGLGRGNVVMAMEQAVGRLESFHGILTEHLGSPDAPRSTVEIWWEGDKYVEDWKTFQKISDGQQEWIVHETDRQVEVRIPMGEKRHYDLRTLADWATANPHRIVGQEEVLGRKATKLEGTFATGTRFAIWVDVETNLPIRFYDERNQSTIEYISFEANPPLAAEMFTFAIPEGWRVFTQQVRVATVAEGARQLGFTPLELAEAPRQIVIDGEWLWFDYGDTQIRQKRSPGPSPIYVDNWMTLGKAAGGPALFGEESVSWRQGEVEVQVLGKRWAEFARHLAPDLTAPDPKVDLAADAAVAVAVDLDAAKALQAQWDRGALRDAPPNVDLERVAVSFAGLGEGASHKLPTMSAATGLEAVVDMPEGPYARIYARRLVREGGLWFVVGYDPR